jgi:hypothetical protein
LVPVVGGAKGNAIAYNMRSKSRVFALFFNVFSTFFAITNTGNTGKRETKPTITGLTEM